MSNQLQTTVGRLRAWVSQDTVVSGLKAALGGFMEADTFVSHMLTAFQGDDKIAACSDESKFRAVHECAALGLLPTLDQVRLIPYGQEVKAMPQWQGYKVLMERHPDILEVQGVLVHVDDTCFVTNGEPSHDYDPFDSEREIKSSDDIKGGYCKISYTNGRKPKYHFTPVRQIIKARACAKTKNVWDKWFEQMALKTLYRDCYARRAVPIDPMVQDRLQKVLKHDDVQLGNDPNRPAQEAKRTTLEAQLAKQTALMTSEPEKASDAPETPPSAPLADPETYEDFRSLILSSETIADVERHKTDALNVLTAADDRADIESDADEKITELNVDTKE